MRDFLKKNKWTLVVTSLIILLPVAVGLLLWDKLPEQVPFHWGINGEVDGWATKTQAVFLLPLLMLGIQWLCSFVTQFDPKGKNHDGKMMGLVLWIIPVLNLFLHVMVWLQALGREVNMAVVMPLFMGALFVIIGNYLPKCRQSYTVGIKLPWTLDDEENWNKTHRLAGKLWVAGGLLLVLCSFFSRHPVALYGSIAVILLMVTIPTVYSYLYYKQHSEE